MALIAIAVISVGLIVWGLFADFRVATTADYWPIGLLPVSVSAYWIVRNRRLKADVELWHSALECFPDSDFPGKDFDPAKDAAGWMTARGNVNFGRVASQVRDQGIHLRVAFNNWRFYDKLIPWTEIARMRYKPEDVSGKFGDGSRGHAGIEFVNPRSLQLVIPWRETFNESVPEKIGLQTVQAIPNQ